MSKNIIYCADGTWNSGDRTNTNVHRFYTALVSDSRQAKLYDPGVGSAGGFFARLRGGAFGEGLIENVREGYERIAGVYEEGDRLFLVGFSRGAYTARSLGGMIAYATLGIVLYGIWRGTCRPVGRTVGLRAGWFVDQAFHAYRNRDRMEKKWADPPDEARVVDGTIAMIGVWDTVGTLGIPGAIFGRLDRKAYGFLDTRLHRNVETIEQVWFGGVHCDVGGGFHSTSLADITLAWMLSNAEKHGVEIDRTVAATYPALLLDRTAALGPVNRSWNPLWGFPHRRSVGNNALVANSVAYRVTERSRYSPPLSVDRKPWCVHSPVG